MSRMLTAIRPAGVLSSTTGSATMRRARRSARWSSLVSIAAIAFSASVSPAVSQTSNPSMRRSPSARRRSTSGRD
ncbi:hypothetical protein [Amnibacterium kyonggiense]